MGPIPRRPASTFHLVEHLPPKFYPQLIATLSASEASIKEVGVATCAQSTRDSIVLCSQTQQPLDAKTGASLRHQCERMRQARALIGLHHPYIGRFGVSLVCRLLSTPKCLTRTFAVDPYLSLLIIPSPPTRRAICEWDTSVWL